ncbi:MAG TPA: RNA ligase family protein [Actinoplanes sp.]|nr:RNA ligase family protein [Actinoplanes sp.]
MHEYPRTLHLPDSPGAPADRLQPDLSWLDGELVVTEKLDGTGLVFTRDAVHGAAPAPAQALWAMTAHRIPDDWRVCGESMWVRRRVRYTDLPGVFIVFGIWDETGTLLGWDDTVDWADRLELPVVPVLYRGASISEARAAWAAQRDPAASEGFVVRSAGRIPAAEFGHRVLQWVRPDHQSAPCPDTVEVNEFA